MNNFDIKRIKIEKLVGYPLFIVAAIIFAPFAVATIKGMIGLIVAFGITAVSYYLAPAAARLLANMRINALKKVAAMDPIGTLESIYAERKEALMAKRDNIKQRIAISKQIKRQIDDYEERFKKPSPRAANLASLNQLIAIGKSKYERACVEMEQFESFLEEQRSDWEIKKSMCEANRLANVGQDFTSQLMEGEAMRTIQNGLDLAFTELDAAIMDEKIDKVLSGQAVEVSAAPATAAFPKLISARTSDLDFDFVPEPEPITVNKR